MKSKLISILVLLCVSVMGWATDWTGYVVGSAPNVTIGDNAPVSINYKVNYLVEYNDPTLTITIDFSEANGLDQAAGFSPQIFVNGAHKGNFSGNTWSSSDYSEGTTLSIYFYFAYQFDANGSSQFNYTIPAASSGGGEEPGQGGGEQDPDPEPAGINWDNISWLENGSGNAAYTDKYKISLGDPAPSNVVNIQTPGWPVTIAGPGIYVEYPSAAFGDCSIDDDNMLIYGAGVLYYMTAFTTQETVVSMNVEGVTRTFTVYYADGTSPDTELPVMTSASLIENSETPNSVEINVAATDNVGVTKYVVKNGDALIGNFAPEGGKIVVTGLTPSTAYTLTVFAKDAAGNVSSSGITLDEFTTPSITPKTYNGYAYSTDKHVFIKYTITRTSEQNLTFSIVREVQGIAGAANPYVFIGGIEQGQMTGSNGSFTYTKTGPFADDAELAISFKTPYAGGDNFVNFNYIVASEQAEPTYPVGAVALNKYASTLSVGGTDNLSATAYPSFATNAGAISWNSDATSYATVDAGTVTAIAAGSANITATCGGVTSSPCVVTVVEALEEAKYYGMGTFSDYSEAKNAFAYEYCFTRSSNNEVTLDVVFSKDMTGIISNDNFKIYINLAQQGMTYNAETKTASYAFGAQTEGTGISYYFYFIMEGGVHQTPSVTYTVGSSNDKVYACVMDENIDNTSVLTAYNGRTAQVILDRTFAKDAGHYTLVLPFDLDEDAVAAKLPGTVTELKESYPKPNGDLKLNFVDVTSMTAGKAYLYLPSQAVANPVFENVTIKSALVTTDTDQADFIGIYAPMTIVALQGISNSYVLGADNYLYESSLVSTTGGDMKALRAYFTLNFSAQSSVQGRRPRAMVVFNEPRTDMPTDVEDVEQVTAPVKRIENGQLIIEKNGRLYNAQGQVIR